MVDAKRCTKCGQDRPLDCFSLDRMRADGLRRWCKECVAESMRAYYERTRQRILDGHREYYQAHRERIIDRALAYHVEHRAERIAAARRYYERQTGRFVVLRAKREAAQIAAGGTFTAQEWAELCVRYGHRCLRCGKTEPDVKLGPDHIVPLARGGTNDISNIQPLCFPCNRWKHAKTVDFRQ